MRYLKTFETFTNNLPKAVNIENETSLMDKTVDKEVSEEEQEELEKEEKSEKSEKDNIKTKK